MPFQEDLPDPGIEPGSPALQADALLSEPLGKVGRVLCIVSQKINPMCSFVAVDHIPISSSLQLFTSIVILPLLCPG